MSALIPATNQQANIGGLDSSCYSVVDFSGLEFCIGIGKVFEMEGCLSFSLWIGGYDCG